MSTWVPKAPGDCESLAAGVADLANGGPVYAGLSVALGDALAERYGASDIEMAVRYSWNALRHLWLRLTPAQRAARPDLILAVAATLRDAERLYHWQRDDDDSYGKATFRGFVNVANELWKGETGEDANLFEHPRTDPLAPYREACDPMLLDLYDVTQWLPDVFRERFERSDARGQRLVVEHLRSQLAIVDSIVPASIEHGLVLAWAIAATDGFPAASGVWRPAMDAGKPLLAVAGAVPDSTRRSLSKWLGALRLLAGERTDGEPYLHELDSFGALVAGAREGRTCQPGDGMAIEVPAPSDSVVATEPSRLWSRLVSVFTRGVGRGHAAPSLETRHGRGPRQSAASGTTAVNADYVASPAETTQALKNEGRGRKCVS